MQHHESFVSFCWFVSEPLSGSTSTATPYHPVKVKLPSSNIDRWLERKGDSRCLNGGFCAAFTVSSFAVRALSVCDRSQNGYCSDRQSAKLLCCGIYLVSAIRCQPCFCPLAMAVAINLLLWSFLVVCFLQKSIF